MVSVEEGSTLAEGRYTLTNVDPASCLWKDRGRVNIKVAQELDLIIFFQNVTRFQVPYGPLNL